MKLQALGMIETRGLVAAIEAADVATKTAEVTLLGYEKVTGGLIMVAVTGEVAAVQAAISAGSAAAEKIGQLISRHVIPRPAEDLEMLFQEEDAEPDNNPSAPGPGGEGPGPGCTAEDNANLFPQDKRINPLQQNRLVPSEIYLQSLTVGELRRMARKTEGIAIYGRQISKANKEQLITEILRAHKAEIRPGSNIRP
ncbi:BMC domain-containing protein [Zhaonella formicivorans]|uniref:BMC domain-containing protein n=1 Tax=Zhaonella formicivorans TaxID=2528593 RepID=UPI0010EFA2D3